MIDAFCSGFSIGELHKIFPSDFHKLRIMKVRSLIYARWGG
jgi:hypothetical protein